VNDLVARTRPVDGALDLLALAGATGVLHERGGVGLAGRGVARRVPVGDAEAVLASIGVDDAVGRPGTGPVAFGALPFDAAAPATVLVPELVWGRGDDGTAWVTTIGTGTGEPDVEALCVPAATTSSAAPDQVTVTSVRPEAWWRDLVARATAEMRSAGPDGLSKVVLAREVLAEADQPFDRARILGRLRERYPGCFLFHVEGFLGASPELLVSRDGELVRAQPMAGTAPRGDDAAEDAALAAGLLASPTYRHEHQITIDMVYDTLLPWCSYLDYEAEPSIVSVANVQHLATLVEGRLSDPTPSIPSSCGPCTPRRRSAGGRGRWPRPGSPTTRASTGGATRARSGGSTGPATARSR
jgi:menaquinone-specific isochorismate synthase